MGKGKRGLWLLALLGAGVIAAATSVGGRAEPVRPVALDALISAKIAYADRDLPRAERLAREHLEARPEAVDARLLLARILLERGRAEEARDVLATATRGTDVLRLLGLACKALGQNDAAIRHLREATETRRDDPGLWRELGLAQREDGDILGALTSFQKSLTLDPKQPDLSMALADLARGKPADPLAMPGMSPRLDPMNPKPLNPRTLVPGPSVPDPNRHFPRPLNQRSTP